MLGVEIIMKKRRVTILLIILTCVAAFLVLYGGGDDAYVELFAWDEHDRFYGLTLTIATTPELYRGSFGAFVGAYRLNNRDVQIHLIDYGSDLERARERIGVELMSGTAPLLIDANLVDFHNPSTAVLLADWLPNIYNHPRFNEDDWFTNVFDATMRHGGLYAFPSQFTHYYVVVNNNIPGLLEAVYGKQSISIGEMIDIFDRIYATFDNLQPMYIGNFSASWLLANSIDDFFDFESARVEFNSPRFIDFINRANEITSSIPRSGARDTANRRLEAEFAQRYFFRLVLADALEYFSVFDEDTLFSNPMLVTNNQGQLLIDHRNTLVLNAGATPAEQAFALDFVLLLNGQDGEGGRPLGDEMHEFLLGGAYNTHAGARPTNRHLLLHDSMFSVHRFLPLVYSGWRTYLSRDEITEMSNIKITTAAEMPMSTLRFAPWPIENIIFETLEQFESGLLTAGQAAQGLQNRITLVLMEAQ